MKTRKGCWTCSERRVACDGGKPNCAKCIRGSRHCQGYDARLSWPKVGDKKRSVVSYVSGPRVRRGAKMPFINTVVQDLQLYYFPELVYRINHALYKQPSPWHTTEKAESDAMDLISYFRDYAHPALNTFVGESPPLRDFLLRLALRDTSTPGRAILNSILALSELHRAGRTDRALQLKVLALQYLSAATKQGSLTNIEAAQVVGASMVLGVFDTLQPFTQSDDWLSYTKGAARIAVASGLMDDGSDETMHLVSWVQFHDVLSGFPARQKQIKSESPTPESLVYRTPMAAASLRPQEDMLSLLSEVYEAVQTIRDGTQEYEDRISLLQQRVERLAVPEAARTSDTTIAVDIWQKATQIYLARATQSICPADHLDQLIEEAFQGPIQNCSCPHFFPLFVVACEARTDARRRAILDLIDRAEKSGLVRSKLWLKDVIQATWVQMDLHADDEILDDYIGTISRVIGSADVIPSFA